MAVQRAYKVRLYPTSEQANLFDRTFGCVRLVYNLIREDYIKSYEETGRGVFKTPAKYKDKLPFLRDVDSQALNYAQMHIQTAYKNFFASLKGKRRKVGYPKPKTKKRSKRSFSTYNGSGAIRIEGGKLRLPKTGLVKAVFHRHIPGRIRNVTVSQTAKGHYYASILTEYEPQITERPPRKKEKVLGIVFSFGALGVPSQGTIPKYPRWYRRAEKKLAREQKKLSRKKKGSANREKQRRKVVAVHEKMANQRKDYAHKLSYRLAKKYDTVVVEDIDLQAMAQGLRNGKPVYDAGFGMFRVFLEYKLQDRLKQLVKADRHFAPSQICSDCGEKSPAVKDVSVRQLTCPHCGTAHDRDVSSAINLVHWHETTAAPAECEACRESVSPRGRVAVLDEAGKIVRHDLASPGLAG